MILPEDPRRYLEDTEWITHFGTAGTPLREDYNMVTSLRTTYSDRLEVEFGLTTPQRANTDYLPEGTRRVVSDGCRIILDPHGALAALSRAVTERCTAS